MKHFKHPVIRFLLHVLVVAVVLVSCTGCAVNGEWTTRDTVLEATYQVVNAMDAYSTSNIQHLPDVPVPGTNLVRRVEEGSAFTRAIIGPRPSTTDTYLYFATVGLSHWLIARSLPPKWRPWFQGGTALYQGEAVTRNCRRGLCD